MTDKKKRERTKCEIYSRVVGFLTPVSRWNIGKRQEFEDRTEYKSEVTYDEKV